MPPRMAKEPCSSTGSSRVKPASTSRSARFWGSISVPDRISSEALSRRSGRLPRGTGRGEFRRLRLHRVALEEPGGAFETRSKLNTDFEFFESLHKLARPRQAQDFELVMNTLTRFIEDRDETTLRFARSRLLYESALQAITFESEDKTEGTTAFLEKRKARFKGE